jgi:hypothetical protein
MSIYFVEKVVGQFKRSMGDAYNKSAVDFLEE